MCGRIGNGCPDQEVQMLHFRIGTGFLIVTLGGKNIEQVHVKLGFDVPKEAFCFSHSRCEVRLQKAMLYAIDHILKIMTSQQFSELALVAFAAGTEERKELEDMLMCMGLPNMDSRIIESSTRRA